MADRLRRAHGALGVSQAKAARKLDIGRTTWGNYCTGLRPLPIDLAIKFCEAYPGITLDWLYRGVPDDLSAQIAFRVEPIAELLKARRAASK